MQQYTTHLSLIKIIFTFLHFCQNSIKIFQLCPLKFFLNKKSNFSNYLRDYVQFHRSLASMACRRAATFVESHLYSLLLRISSSKEPQNASSFLILAHFETFYRQTDWIGESKKSYGDFYWTFEHFRLAYRLLCSHLFNSSHLVPASESSFFRIHKAFFCETLRIVGFGASFNHFWHHCEATWSLFEKP